MRRVRGRIAAIASLNEPMRQRLYDWVASNEDGTTRDAAAKALSVPRSVAAFHLDKLAAAGLLEVEFRRPPGRRGPGAGRPAKFYRRAVEELSVSIPERRYDLSARLLAEAVERAEAEGRPVREALAEVARREGERIASTVQPPEGWDTDRIVELLADSGYEPRCENGTIKLGNCPFHVLAVEHMDLVCNMNTELLAGLAEAVGLPRDAVRLDPSPGRCCVTLKTASQREAV